MSYDKQTWQDGRNGGTPLTASRLNHIEDGVAGIDTRVTANESTLAGRLSDTTLAATLCAVVEEAPPTGFTFAHLALPTVLRTRDGFRVAVNVDALRPAVGVTYFVSPTAPAGAAGTPLAPMRLGEALLKSDVGTIYIAPGEYDRANHVTTAVTGKNLNLIATGPGVKITGWNAPSSTAWVLVSGAIYSTTRSATTQVVDVYNLTPWGDYTTYTKQADLASITGPGQWAIVGTTVYVWALNSTDLSSTVARSQIRLGVTARTGLVVGDGVHYVRGIDFEGCDEGGARAYGTAVVIAEDCTFRYSLGNGGAQTGGGYGYIAIRCTASGNAADGFNYHAASGVSPDVIEIDCRAHHNGMGSATDTNNATTSHEVCRVLRVNGTYDSSKGPVVADVNSSRSWNLGCSAGRSTAISGSQAQSWRVDAVGFDSDPAQMHLVECTATDPVPYKVTGPGVLNVKRSWPVYAP